MITNPAFRKPAKCAYVAVVRSRIEGCSLSVH